jgi:hypothetical protein
MRYVSRVVYVIYGDHRAAIDEALTRCARENRGQLLAEPTVRFSHDWTELEVNRNQWWHEWAAVELPRLSARHAVRSGLLSPDRETEAIASLRAKWRGSRG